MENNAVLRKIERNVDARLIFFLHLASFAIINALLIINLTTSPQYFWFKWPILGWGVAICFHTLIIFVFYGKSSLRERMIKKEMEEEK